VARFNNTFEFIGNIAIPKPERFYEVKENATKTWEGHRLSFGVQESKLNTVFVEIYGGRKPNGENKVFTFSKSANGEKGSKLEISWADRLKPEVVDMVAHFKKIIVDLETDQEVKKSIYELLYKIRNIENKDTITEDDKSELAKLKEEYKALAKNRFEFISEYDAIVLLANKLTELKDYKFRVRGNIDFTEYKGKYYKKFYANFIEIVPNDTENKLTAKINIFFDKDSLDETDLKEDKKAYINGWVQNYNRATKADGFIPQQFIINASKLDFDDETHMAYYNLLADTFKVKKGYYCLPFDVNVYRGAEKIDFTYDDLTDEQKKYVQLGIKTIEDFAPRGGMFGTNIEEFRLVAAILEDEYKDGRVDTGLNDEEFAELLFKSTADVNLSDELNKQEQKQKIKQEDKTNTETDLKAKLNSLFG